MTARHDFSLVPNPANSNPPPKSKGSTVFRTPGNVILDPLSFPSVTTGKTVPSSSLPSPSASTTYTVPTPSWNDVSEDDGNEEEGRFETYPTIQPLDKDQFDQQRNRRLNQLEEVERATDGFEGIGWAGIVNKAQLYGVRKCLMDGATGGVCGIQGHGLKLVLIGYKYLACALLEKTDDVELSICQNSGEAVWMRSVPENLASIYDMFSHSITHVWSEEGLLLECFSNSRCIQSDSHPSGIPPYKLFTPTFWGHPPRLVHTDYGEAAVPSNKVWSWNPLGPEWTLSPYRMPGNITYIGYNIQNCTDTLVVPHADRQNAILLLAKKTKYFYLPAAWPLSWYATTRESTGLNIISGAYKTAEVGGDVDLPGGIEGVSRMGRVEYEKLLGSVKALVGIGSPPISPSPFNALCQGVPVILPYSGPSPTPEGWDLYDFEKIQHGPAASIGPPSIHSAGYDRERNRSEDFEIFNN
ncbi:hypothetical protein [Phaffia rhodozyma]|uniref:Uncharacterized protein n=1 Tax=Phaffia rhodozyma TaxID=264483 RepID=A0A0F7SFI3_PHARH|nr:hypothetical protein [Phaffia rhodozyma]